MPASVPHAIVRMEPPAYGAPPLARSRHAVGGLREDRTMTRAHAQQLERDLQVERARLQREVERLTTPPTDAAGAHGRFADDEIASTAGTSAEVDHALAAYAARELYDVDSALARLHEDPLHFGLCATCARPIPIARLRLVPGTRYCRAHVPS